MSNTRKPVLFRKKVKRAAIVFRPGTATAAKLAQQLAQWLAEHSVEVFSHPSQKVTGAKKLTDPAVLDMVVVLGGDGTYLQAVRMIEGYQIPMLGVNMGSLGFLTIHRADELFELMKQALGGELELKSRSMAQINIKRGGRIVHQYSALNDLVIERGPNSHLIHIGISADGMQINALKADGLIVATPTGSTAYSLAAGGPILHPEVNALVVTPICAHALTSRPFIFPDDRKVSFHLLGKAARAMLTVDGSKRAKLSARDEVVVERHKSEHLILRRPSHNFFSLLRDKLKFGERA